MASDAGQVVARVAELVDELDRVRAGEDLRGIAREGSGERCVERGAAPIGAPFGDAFLAGVATGVFPDYAVAKQWAEYVAPTEPNPANRARYQDYFGLYKQLYSHVKEDFRSLAQIRDRYA